MKTIIYYGNTLYPDKDASAHRTIGNAKALREIGYKVIFIGCKMGNVEMLESKEIFEGFVFHYYPNPVTMLQWKEYLFDFKPLKRVLNQNNAYAVVLYNHPSISSQRILSYCHKRGIKVYADCTEWYDPKGFSIHTAIKKADTWYRMTHVNKRLDGVIAISSYLHRYYIESGCSSICVPPLVDLSSKKWQQKGITDKNKKTRINLIYVGNPGAGAKDKLGLIIIALKNLRFTHSNLSFILNVIGMTKKQFEESFRLDVSDCDFVDFLGRRSNKEALGMIMQSDYSIFLRDSNLVCTAGFPTKFSESIACGTPVLTNLTSDIGDYMTEGKNGFLIDTKSFDSVCSSLYSALVAPAVKIAEMKDYCRCDKSFDYHSFIDEFKKMF